MAVGSALSSSGIRILSTSSPTWLEKPTEIGLKISSSSRGEIAAMRPQIIAGRFQEGRRILQLKTVGYSGLLYPGCSRKIEVAAALLGSDYGVGAAVAVKNKARGFVGQQALLNRNWSVNGGSFALSAASKNNGNGSQLSGSIRKRDAKLGVLRAVTGDGESVSLELEVQSLSKELEPSPAFSQWDATTSRFADSATAAFLVLQLPQLILNTQNLLSNNPTALFAIPWMGYLTGLLGNLSLLSYFASKKERGAMVVQAVGVITCLMVLSQLAIAGAMPSTAFAVTATVSAVGLVLNFLNYNNKLSPEIWRLWGEAISIGGVTVLPQVMWSTFEPYIPHSILPGIIFGTLAASMIILARLGKLPPKAKDIVGGVSAWTATLLFMWPPIAQWWQNYLYPANIKGLSVFTVLLAMIGNALLLPRALFTRDLMWFTGSSWGSLLQGWAILLTMYMVEATSDLTFWGVSGALFLWLSNMLWQDSKAYELSSPLSSLVELILGRKLS